MTYLCSGVVSTFTRSGTRTMRMHKNYLSTAGFVSARVHVLVRATFEHCTINIKQQAREAELPSYFLHIREALRGYSECVVQFCEERSIKFHSILDAHAQVLVAEIVSE